MEKEVVVSGIRPTGFLHLGNYFGAMRNYVRMQDDFNCYFFVANWHSLTTHPDTKELKNSVYRVIAENIACGLDPQKVAFYVQSDVPEIAELYLYLNMLSYKGELEKTVTFKEKVRMQPENVNAGLLTYPVLQAADIIIQRAVKVPVGKDHYRYGEVFPLPYAFNYGDELIRIMGLDGNGKMSKSENQNATIYLADDDELIRKKIMKAKTDQGPAEPNSAKPDYIQNLFTMMKLVSTADTLTKFEDDFNASSNGNCIIRYGDMKKQLAEDMVLFIKPIREKAADLLANPEELHRIIKQGADKGRSRASETLKLVRDAVGLNY
ncbi:MAG: tryptophan--tRNA ligase [Sphingobacteriia bacterium 32-37-4]|nr:MAG: tryptophan--tRNA ligase [Sphingobacteriia bacterium 32-37-4]